MLTNNIEAPRLEQEEHLRAQGWQFRVDRWHDVPLPAAQGLKLGADVAYPGAVNLDGEIAHLRADLLYERVAEIRRAIDAASRR